MMKLVIVYLLLILQICVAEVMINNWHHKEVAHTINTTVTLQVVVNPYIRRGSPIHFGTFKALTVMGADNVRFVPWLPYPQLGVAELYPPTGGPVCATIPDGQNIYLSCPSGNFTDIHFASYGNPSGECGQFKREECDIDVISVIEEFCLGEHNCTIPINYTTFGKVDCADSVRLSFQASCSDSTKSTSWNFTLIDPMVEDLMNAQDDKTVIINFSTIPQWMWNAPLPSTWPSDPDIAIWDYEKGFSLRDDSLKEISEYYARLVSYYTQGGFEDEYGKFHKGYYYDFQTWEVFNEIDGEHGMSAEYYTRVYDAVVSAIRKVNPTIKFMGLALESRTLEYFQYFLNASNHLPDIPIDAVSFHFYAETFNRTNATGFESFFQQVDDVMPDVRAIVDVRNRLSPHTIIDMDEVGVILGDDNNVDPFPPQPDNTYWAAAGAMFSYMWSQVLPLGIEIFGESQLVGYPTQYPSVSMMDYNSDGLPNAKFWVLYLLKNHFQPGDSLVETLINTPDTLVQTFSTSQGKKVLIINKTTRQQDIVFLGAQGATFEYIDGTTWDNPPMSVVLSSGGFVVDSFCTGVVYNLAV
eukprot:TRINITY_DN6500_c0_g1_i1.p1 TRINITY_DN6500_c0_g1~~TRINITY_DN6500_c0_g1_i1.p1  ORF type:complete len:582 (-),score=150.67 TRINITY_DN6500_c0_g1_i1:93-1838(-)